MEILTLKQQIEIFNNIKDSTQNEILTAYLHENFNSPTLKKELVDICINVLDQTVFRATDNVETFLKGNIKFEIKINAIGTQFELIEELKIMIENLKNFTTLNDFNNQKYELDSFNVDYQPSTDFKEFYAKNIE